MTRDQMTGKSISQLVDEINHQRRAAGLSNIAVTTRPSSSGEGTTIEVFGGDVLLAKSINGGVINWFLKGMWAGFGNAAPPKVAKFNPMEIGNRAINWRD